MSSQHKKWRAVEEIKMASQLAKSSRKIAKESTLSQNTMKTSDKFKENESNFSSLHHETLPIRKNPTRSKRKKISSDFFDEDEGEENYIE
jgi:hypothetical protein